MSATIILRAEINPDEYAAQYLLGNEDELVIEPFSS